MTAAGTAVVTDPRPGAPAYVASVYADGQVLDLKRFEHREAAQRWLRRRVAELFPELFTLRERMERLGYRVQVEPAPRDGEAGWYAFAEVEGRVVGTGFGDTEEDALRSLAGELGLEVRP